MAEQTGTEQVVENRPAPQIWNQYMREVYWNRKGPEALGTVSIDDIEEKAKERLKDYPGWTPELHPISPLLKRFACRYIYVCGGKRRNGIYVSGQSKSLSEVQNHTPYARQYHSAKSRGERCDLQVSVLLAL